jgi:hypothetical protein
MIHVLPRWLLAAALFFLVPDGRAQAIDPLPAETRLVGVSGAPSTTMENFTIAAPAQNLVITLTDLQTPAALSSATVVVTQGGAIVGEAIMTSPATSASFSITGAVGQYTLYVFGAPNASYSVGTFTVCVAPSTSTSNCIQNASISGNISAAAATADPTVSTVSATLNVITGGAYTVTFADDQFPAALNVAPNLALFQGSQVIMLAIQSGTMINLSPGTYTLLAVAQASQTLKAGLYGIKIAGPPGSTPLLDASYAVGELAPSLYASNPSAQTLMLSVTDFQFPSPLATASAIVTSGSTVLGSASIAAAAPPSNFQAPAGVLQIWSFATAGAAGGGTYQVDLMSATATLLQTAAAVNNGTSLAFAYTTSALAAGSYQATATDFQFPAVLPTLKFAVAQNGVILKQAAVASTVNFSTPAATAPVFVLVGVTPPSGGNGILDVNVQTPGVAPQLLFDQTQAVSLTDLFDTQTINLGSSGSFNVTLTDLKFPAQFQDLDLIVSTGGVILGKIIGSGTIPLAATPGAYQLTFIATPAAQQQYGMYALSIVNAPPGVTLMASPTTVAAGKTTTLTWTSTNATSCMGSGGAFAGAQANSGTTAVIVSATTTFMLTCTGPGGMNAQSATVTATTPPSSSSGGGEIDLRLVGLLGCLALFRIHGKLRLAKDKHS